MGGMSNERREEAAACAVHAVGIALALVGTVVLVVLAAASGDVWRIVSCSVYGVTLILLYVASTLYHGVQQPGMKRWFRILDHSSIYLLIAGTYTPFTLVTLRGPWGWSLFGVTWGLAIGGLALKLTAFDRFRRLSTLLYLLMGWLVVIAIKPILALLAARSIALLVTGGILYTLGVFFYASGPRLRYSHAVWHVFVLSASICHYLAVVSSIA
jgi:hemolysin III